MQKRKEIILEHIRILLDQNANQLARIMFQINLKKSIIVTAHYAKIQKNIISWQENLTIQYHSEEELAFETNSESEYGFKPEQMKSRYQGIIYIKPESFNQLCTAPVFKFNGEKIGTLQYILKLNYKKIGLSSVSSNVQLPSYEIPEELIPSDVKGKIYIYSIKCNVKQNVLNRKFKKFIIKVGFGKQEFTTKIATRESLIWTQNIKFDKKQQQQVNFQLLQSQFNTLIGKSRISILTLDLKKRFLTHSILIYDNQTKPFGQLILDMRFLSKKQLIQLKESRYSPDLKETSLKKQTQSIILPKRKKIVQKSEHQISTILRNNQSKFSRAKRFSQSSVNNQKVSYIDPSFFSEFKIINGIMKGPSIGLGKKHDFNDKKGIPGVGLYKLPSIWNKS